MKLIYRNHIEKLKEEERKVARNLTKYMLDIDKKERKIWISGQNLLK